jgi:hypothetical protein
VTIKFHGLVETEGAVAVGSSAVLGCRRCTNTAKISKNMQTESPKFQTQEFGSIKVICKGDQKDRTGCSFGTGGCENMCKEMIG